VFPYAQTNLQLYRQLAAEGYDAADVETVGRAHEVGLRLFPGTYRGSGKPFLAHLVGTASVLVSLRARVPVVVTGLLHAVYTHGEFGNGWPGMTDVRRAKIRSEVGEEIEDLIARYTRLTWKRSTIPRIRAGLDGMGPVERDVLLVRLANELEDHLDLGILYLDNHADRREFMETDLPATVEMAERLGFPALAKGLAETFAEVASAHVSPALQRPHAESFQIPFASHRPRFRVALSHLLGRRPWRRGRPA
jgi:Guanosine polyphosphate pyrophosphohydrolases/synthetases